MWHLETKGAGGDVAMPQARTLLAQSFTAPLALQDLGVFPFGWQHPIFFLLMLHIGALKKMKLGFICTREGLPFAKPRFA